MDDTDIKLPKKEIEILEDNFISEAELDKLSERERLKLVEKRRLQKERQQKRKDEQEIRDLIKPAPDINIIAEKMPAELKKQLSELNPFARRYCEFRAKGLSQGVSSKKAGSKGKTTACLCRVGWNTEQLPGVKDYILWLEHKRVRASVIDKFEIIEKLRDVYTSSMDKGKFNDSLKSLEMLGSFIGLFSGSGKGYKQPIQEVEPNKDEKKKNDTKAFTQDMEEEELDIRLVKLNKMLKEVKVKK